MQQRFINETKFMILSIDRLHSNNGSPSDGRYNRISLAGEAQVKFSRV